MASSFTVPLNTRDNDLELVGGKGRSLSRMANLGFDVPGGFQIPTTAYRQFVARHELQDRIIALAKPSIVEGTLSFEQASTEISQLFADHALSSEELAAISDAYENLPGQPAVAVRSSANAEDLPDLSFAGQQETFLNVTGADEVAAAVKKCWASLWTGQAMNYRHEMCIEHETVAMGVVVQTMIPSEVSGILFTANPVTGSRKEMIINCSFGLGEAVVSGQVTPDTFIVDRESLTVSETTLGEKAKQIVADGAQGTRMEDINEAQQATPSLDTDAIEKLAKLAVTVEQEFDGVPQDIEWAIAADQLWLLQARPITNLPIEPPDDIDWPEIPGAQLYKRMASEIMPEPLSPLFEDLYLKGLYDTQTWPDDWQWKGSFTVNYLSNFIIATVNGYAFQAIYVDQGEKSRLHWAKVREDRGTLPWYRVLKAVFMPPKARGATEKVNVNDVNAAGRMILLMDIQDGPLRWIWLLNHWWRSFTRADAVTRWRKIDLPSYLAKLERWRGLAPEQATMQELLAGIRALTLAEARYWHVLRGIIGAAKMTDQTLQNFLARNAPDQGLSSGIFLSGFSSKTLDAERDMRAIAERIRRHRAIFELMLTTPIGRFLDELKAHPEGAEVFKLIDNYLNEHGKQVFNLDFVEPALIEAPLPFLTNLKAMVRHSGFDLSARQKEVSRKRRAKWIQALKYFATRRAVEDAPNRAGGGTVSKSALLEFIRLYWTARVNYPVREAAIFYMGAAWSLLRPFALELGQRLVDFGTLENADDVFYLTNDELQQAVEARVQDKALPELKAQAAAQRHLREQRSRLQQPAAIPEENQLAWATGGKSFDTIKINEDDAEVVSGFAVSPGTVTGTVSLIMSPDEFDKMRPDTILVCPLTTPAWTQLFPYASGLVTDIGSITAHGSIVAREYGIPAVLGTGNGTRLIKHGQQITVDGDGGTVTILED
jgi:rifampicin phosphotransferase